MGHATEADRFAGVLLGAAVGDAVGLPFEGMSRRRVRRMAGDGSIGHRFLFRRGGMISDDTEHASMVAQALIRSGGEPARFARSLDWRLRWWLLGLPAGVGKATALSVIRLWLGVPPSRSGVCSAGNGAAMRAAVIGVYAANDPDRLAALVGASSRITHTDPRAEQGALAIAIAAAYAAARDVRDVIADELLSAIVPRVYEPALRSRIETAFRHAADGRDVDDVTETLGLSRGVSGFVNDTVPVALFCWLRHRDDARLAIESAVRAGGDTDSVAAIVGGLCGASLGAAGIPAVWVNGLVEWPRSVRWMRTVADRLHRAALAEAGIRPAPLFWPSVLVRNVFFLAVVLVHALRRLLPPYG